MSKYLELAKVGTKYAKRMNHLSNKIFGEVARITDKKSMKVVKLFSEKPIDKRPEIVEYYPRLEQTDKLVTQLRAYGLFQDEHEDFNEYNDKIRSEKGTDKKDKKNKTVTLS